MIGTGTSTASGDACCSAGAVGAAVAGGYALTRVRPPKPINPPPAPRQPVPVAQNPAPPPEPPSAQSQKPASPQLSKEERIQLQNIRGMMESQLTEFRTDYNNLTHDREILVSLFRKNGLKFVAKKGLDVFNTVTTSGTELGTQVFLDPIMNQAFSKHDTSKDANIILRTHQLLNLNGSRIQEVRKEIIHLKNEIEMIDQKLASH